MKEASKAKRRAERRKKQGKKTGCFEFNIDKINTQLAKEYYNLNLTEEEINQFSTEYNQLNEDMFDKFYKITKLSKLDFTFLLLATALQCVRQYFFSNFAERVAHDTTKKADKKLEESISDVIGEGQSGKAGGWYYNKLDSILLDGVPYDKIKGGQSFDLGLGGQNHRYKTLGHDPILGWIIGPLNIMTNTLTTHALDSFHTRGSMEKVISHNAHNDKILEAAYERLQNEPVAFAAAIIKQAIHFHSDVYTKCSLPIPFIQTLSPEFAETLAKNGIDSANFLTVGKQATYSIIINTVISMIHGLFCTAESEIDKKIYQVKTKKIILYSNTIATVSNALYVAFSGDLTKLDVGGFIVTLWRIIKDEKFIRKVMQEFIDTEVSSYYNEDFKKVDDEFNDLLSEFMPVQNRYGQ
ncbi:hypothetical protein AAEX28_07970 [Lentisphaerota bacterium WC36G]|nr:hypothetical protein LJT99_10825 [Lentisphaerae bacterium WC36]